ncbi:MAG: tRNA 2-thiocytidine biosynthesis protein TtcA [Anaerolineaceae bacterium]|nr:tRNA 2-thiocytidine biosynthesis protein TtcA [Anaerolineaceae bacterium]
MFNEEKEKLTFKLLKDFNKAIIDFDMIRPNDHIAVAVSGGKDSLCLLELLHYWQKNAAYGIKLTAIHILGDANGPFERAHLPLINWFEDKEYAHVMEPLKIKANEKLPMNCQRCTWNRRRTLFEIAHEMECNVIAMGHHADDLAQTTLMNVLYQGRAETMYPARDYFGGVFRMIRPMAYIQEKNLLRFSSFKDFPPPLEHCPQSNDTRRRFTADLIREL